MELEELIGADEEVSFNMDATLEELGTILETAILEIVEEFVLEAVTLEAMEEAAGVLTAAVLETADEAEIEAQSVLIVLTLSVAATIPPSVV